MTLLQQSFKEQILLCLSAETAIGKYPVESVNVMHKTIASTESYKKRHIGDFKNKVDIKTNPRKSIVLSIKDLAYNPIVKGIIAFLKFRTVCKISFYNETLGKNNYNFTKY